jgi:hypothetical protein
MSEGPTGWSYCEEIERAERNGWRNTARILHEQRGRAIARSLRPASQPGSAPARTDATDKNLAPVAPKSSPEIK